MVLKNSGNDSKTSANAECDDKRDDKIKDDILLIGLSRFAVVLRAAVLAFDMGEHVGAKRSSPPGVTDFLRVTLSTLWAGSILNWVLHKVPPN